MAVIKDVNNIPKIVQELRRLASQEVEVGVMSDVAGEKVATIARVHEFGARIPKTPKMRRFLAAMMRKYGIEPDPSKGNPDYVIIPPRPFFRSAVRRTQGHLASLAERGVDRVLQGEGTARDALATMGLALERAIKDQINRVNEPPLHPLTVAMKGSDKPLVKTGVMRNAVTWRIKPRGHG